MKGYFEHELNSVRRLTLVIVCFEIVKTGYKLSLLW